jgi:hypothetical protein
MSGVTLYTGCIEGYDLNNVTSLLRIKVDGVSPEVKFFIVCLCHLSGVEAKIIETESVNKLANKLSVSVKSAQQGIRFLVSNGLISKNKSWLGKGELLNIKYEFTGDFYSFIKSNEVNKTTIEADTRIDILMDSAELKNLSDRAAVKLLLLTLLAHSDGFGVVRGLSIKDLHELLGGFTKDKHRSQLVTLRVAGFITEYSAGMSGGILLGKEKSEYLVDFTHKAFSQQEESNQSKTLLIKSNFRDDLFSITRLSAYLTGKELYSKGDIDCSKQLVTSLLTEIKGDPRTAKAKFNCAISAIGNAFNGGVRAFQIQRYISHLAMDILRSPGGQGVGVDDVCKNLRFDELFSDKFLREVITKEFCDVTGKDKLNQRPLSQQPRYYKQLELYMDEVIGRNPYKEQVKVIREGYAGQISAVTWLVSLCVIYTTKEYRKLLTEKGLRPNEQAEAVMFNGNDEFSLYFFGLGCIEE